MFELDNDSSELEDVPMFELDNESTGIIGLSSDESALPQAQNNPAIKQHNKKLSMSLSFSSRISEIYDYIFGTIRGACSVR